MTPKEAIGLAKANDVKIVDIKFADINGGWHRLSMPVNEFQENVFEDGAGIDASSIPGWKSIDQSDMVVIPDATTVFIDPFVEVKTLSFIADVYDPKTKEEYTRSPRTIAKKAQAHLKVTGIGDTAYFGPEAEFFIFDDVRYQVNQNSTFYKIDSCEAEWNTSAEEFPNRASKIRNKGGYMIAGPNDHLNDLRNQMVMTMLELGLEVERHNHEVGAAGQCEIDLRYNTLLKMADSMYKYKYAVRNVAHRYGKTATFMPKPMFGENGSGMHIHMSLWKNGNTLMAGDCYAGLSQEALWYIGGLLKHAPALCAICNPTNNSYRRLVPGYEAPVMLAYSASNRSAVCRIPMAHQSAKAKRVEFRCPDPSANPYLAFSAALMAGLDGIQNKIEPGEAMDFDLYHLSDEQSKKIKTVPERLKAALEALEADHDFLIKGDVFTKDFLDSFVKLKEDEYDQVRLRPHPMEYHLYYDV